MAFSVDCAEVTVARTSKLTRQINTFFMKRLLAAV
jgi:hypothetical protein